MPSRKLVHVAVKVFHRHLVIRPMIPTFQHGPERLNAVCVGLSVHVFPDPVPELAVVFSRRPNESCSASNYDGSSVGNSPVNVKEGFREALEGDGIRFPLFLSVTEGVNPFFGNKNSL